jgi:hypothetical protein
MRGGLGGADAEYWVELEQPHDKIVEEIQLGVLRELSAGGKRVRVGSELLQQSS